MALDFPNRRDKLFKKRHWIFQTGEASYLKNDIGFSKQERQAIRNFVKQNSGHLKNDIGFSKQERQAIRNFVKQNSGNLKNGIGFSNVIF